MVYFMLTGEYPFGHDGASKKNVFISIATGVVSVPQVQDISESAENFVMQLLQRKPDERLGQGGVAQVRFRRKSGWDPVFVKMGMSIVAVYARAGSPAHTSHFPAPSTHLLPNIPLHCLFQPFFLYTAKPVPCSRPRAHTRSTPDNIPRTHPRK